jgi:hypothetical protein
MFPAAAVPGPADEVRHMGDPVQGGEDLPSDWRLWPDLLMQRVGQANETIAQWRRLRPFGRSPRMRLSLGWD